jgi:phage baseplate assembly protein W
MAITYKGFSTYKKQFSNSYTLSGFELAKQDLVNHFNIRKGEKLMNPEFGSIVWDSLYEPLTDEIVSEIEEDIKNIIGYDPRLEAESILLEQYEHGLLLELQVKYIPDQVLGSLLFDFNNTSNQVTVRETA